MEGSRAAVVARHSRYAVCRRWRPGSRARCAPMGGRGLWGQEDGVLYRTIRHQISRSGMLFSYSVLYRGTFSDSLLKKNSPKFAPDCGWWHHASRGKVDPPLKTRVRKEQAMSTNPQDGSQPTVVLVHGAWADGSGWQGVYNLLKDDYSVRIVQNPTLSLEGDVAATKMIIGQQSEPVILVGHSYGGVVITEAGNDPKVAALVYIAGFVPDQGET